jgi:glutamate/tyrosine decarboxylase-like PLP-dependent enzyme
VINWNQENIGRLAHLLKSYLKNPPQYPVQYTQGAKLEKEYDFSLPMLGGGGNELFKRIEDYLKYAVHTQNPRFNNQLFAGISEPAFYGEVITSLLNTSMATYEISPMASLIEKELCRKLNSIVGYAGDEGIMVTGGSNANMLALHCARHRFDETIKQSGNKRNLVAFVSDQAHYSFAKAYNLMGLGLENLIKVKSDDRGRMLVSDLEEKIKKSLNENKNPFFISSTAGTTVLGAFDPIIEIDSIAKKYKLWHHIDGAWGGPVLLSDKYKTLLEGSKLSDSFTWDAHKLMSTGLITTFFLTKHQGILNAANSGGGSRYIFHEYENVEYDTGPDSLQCGRRVDALKFWLHWQYYGDKGVAANVDKLFEKAKYFEGLVKSNPRLKLIKERESLNVCFQVIPKSNVDINECNYKLRFELVKKGEHLVNFSRFQDGTTFFRMVFVNQYTTKNDLDALVKDLCYLDI